MAEVFQPLELQKDGKHTGRWHYTYTNSTGTYTHECCQRCDHAEDGHATPTEAVECFRKHEAGYYIISDTEKKNEFGRCLETGVITSGLVTVGRHFLRQIRLSKGAQTPENIARHFMASF